jgi:hypothetical protein
MLTITSPRVARALAAGRLRSQRRAAWGSLAQRTIDRRYCGILAAASLAGCSWFAQAVRLAGGCPSAHCWQPFGAAPVAQPAVVCHFCQSAIDEATSRCACFGHA